jgi:L-ascorbate metabolism protein UlaG (beta-lactamase superfamily)
MALHLAQLPPNKISSLMIPACQKDAALLADIAAAERSADRFQLWWLGQSGFLLQWNGRHLLFDPYLSDSLTEKYAATDKPHVRMSERVIDPALLDMVDVVTSSHNHTDHLDAATLVPLANTNPGLHIVLPAANIEFARQRLGTAAPPMTGLDDGTSAEVAGFHFTGIAAAHNDIARDSAGRCLYLGFVVRFGPFCVYHSGDTLWHDGLVAALRIASPDVVLVPINGNLPERRVAGNLNGTEAAALAKVCGASLAVPHHFDLFEFNTASPDEFATTCSRLGQPHTVLTGGERLTFTTPVPQ